MAVDRLTGKASYFLYNGFAIPITKATAKGTGKMADATDNGDYDQSTDLLYPTQLKVSAPTEIAIEGRFRKSVIPPNIIAAFYESNPGGLMANFGLDSGTILGHGYFDLTDWQADVPVDDIVTYSATLKSNGKFTPNS
jgi:hypothetical protein